MFTPTHPSARSFAAKLASLAAVAAVLCLTSTPVSAAPKPTPAGPQLTIAVDNGHTSAAAGDKLDYTITLTNTGDKKVSDLLVTQSLPVGTTLLSADSDGDEKSDGVQWKVDVGPTKKITLKTSLELADTPAEVLRLASVACAKVSAKAAPVVCASDSDILPAGEAAADAEAALTTENGATDQTIWYVAGGAVLAAGLATFLLLRSRRHPQRAVKRLT